MSFFSTEIVVLRFDHETINLNVITHIENCCYIGKPGICSIDIFTVANLNNYLVTGAYDGRVRFYQIQEKPSFIGQINYLLKKVNQVSITKYEGSDYLFLASDENYLYIWILT